MSATSSSTCPDPADLAKLLAGALPERQRRELTGHLDACPGCQQSLEKLAVGDTALALAVRDAAAEPPPPSRSKYWHALQELANEPTAIARSGRVSTRLAHRTLSFLSA